MLVKTWSFFSIGAGSSYSSVSLSYKEVVKSIVLLNLCISVASAVK